MPPALQQKSYICYLFLCYQMDTKILIIGACGQIGTELTAKLRATYGVTNVIATDIRKLNNEVVNNGIFEVVNALDYNQIEHLIEQYHITDVYLMAALLSATAEKNPAFAWDLNMNSLFHVLNLAKAGKIKKIFWPSSIAVFGPTTPRHQTPNLPLWNLQPFMVFPNKQAKDGVNITTSNMGWM
jgi:nucleoside-diphosphate-sugar epimerase